MRGLLSLLGLGKSQPANQPAAPLPLDPTLGDPDARILYAAGQHGDWRTLEAGLSRVPTGPDREFFLSALSEIGGFPKWILDWKNQLPRSPHALLTAGVLGVKYAWEARGDGYSDTVTEAMAREFFRRLQLADDLLHSAAVLNPADANCWSWRVTVARGLQLGLEECRARFDEAIHRDPACFSAHEQFLQMICKKWFGSHEQMFDFARAASRTAPEGGRLHALLARAHTERWLAAESDHDALAAGYFAQPPVIAEIIEACRKWSAGAGTPARGAVADRNAFAFCFWKAGRNDLAAEQFAAIGPHITEMPWCYLGEPVRRFHKAREDCGIPATRRAA